MDEGLEHGDDLGQTLVAHVFKHTQYTCLEEDFGGAKLILVGIQLQCGQDLVGHLLAINESLGDSVGGQDGVTLLELRVDDSVGESLATDTDSFKHAVTLQLVQYKPGINKTGCLEFVGDKATNEVRVGGVEVLHQLVQRLPMHVRHRLEVSALLSFLLWHGVGLRGSEER